MSKLIEASVQAGRARLEETIKSLHELTIRIGHTDLADTVSDLRSRIFEPFMFVIVGEVKAGKSSFVNALLDTGREIAKAAPQPMTDVIQQILYGAEEQEVVINQYLKKIMLPVEILKEIAIVDTPGTNTIVEHHQEITERFIPSSDLIVFVFEAKNPYRQSAWDFFDYIHADWQKKIVFVLQQKDLMPTDDLEVNINGVKEYAAKKGIEHPTVFAVSAKQEMEGDQEASGFLPLRKYIQQNITGGQATKLKLINSIDTAQTINNRIADGMLLRRQQYEADCAFRSEVTETLNEQEKQSLKQVDLMTENLLLTYDRITRKRLDELRSGLSMFGLIRRSISSTFGSTPSAKNWLDGIANELESELNTELRNRLNEGVVDLAESIKQMAHLIDLKLRSSKTILQDDHELFASIAERRENVLRDLRDQFNRFVSKTENFADESMFEGKEALAPNLMAGGGIAAIGVVLMALSTMPVFDITGGVLTGIGVLFAGFSTRGKRRKIVEGFEREITNGRGQLGKELEDKLKTYITQLRAKIEDHFYRFDEMLEREANTLDILEGQYKEVEEQLEEIKKAI